MLSSELPPEGAGLGTVRAAGATGKSPDDIAAPATPPEMPTARTTATGSQCPSLSIFHPRYRALLAGVRKTVATQAGDIVAITNAVTAIAHRAIAAAASSFIRVPPHLPASARRIGFPVVRVAKE